MLRKWTISDDQKRKKCIDELLTRIEEQGDSEFGILAAEDLLDIAAQYIGPESFNKGLDTAKKSIQTSLGDLDTQLDMLTEA